MNGSRMKPEPEQIWNMDEWMKDKQAYGYKSDGDQNLGRKFPEKLYVIWCDQVWILG